LFPADFRAVVIAVVENHGRPNASECQPCSPWESLFWFSIADLGLRLFALGLVVVSRPTEALR
jgi:hypothetical protein